MHLVFFFVCFRYQSPSVVHSLSTNYLVNRIEVTFVSDHSQNYIVCLCPQDLSGLIIKTKPTITTTVIALYLVKDDLLPLVNTVETQWRLHSLRAPKNLGNA